MGKCKAQEWPTEIEAAMRASKMGPAGFLTTQEISAKTGRCTRTTLAGLRLLNADGRLEIARVPRTSLDGRTTLVPGYKILPRLTVRS